MSDPAAEAPPPEPASSANPPSSPAAAAAPCAPLGAPPSSPGARLGRLVLFAVVLGLAVKGLVSFFPAPERTPQVGPVGLPPVRLLELQAEAAPRQEERHARLRPQQEWVLALEVGGRLAARPVQNGQELAAGALLLALDPEPFQAELAAAEAGEREAQASLKLAETELVRMEELAQSTATKRALDQARAERDRAQAGLAAAQARQRQARFRLDHARLDAPVTGVVSHLAAEVGQVVAPGQALGRFTRQDVLLVKLLVSAEVRRGVVLGAEASVVDGRERVHPATLARAAPVQAGETGQFELEFEVANPQKLLLSGEPVRVRFSHGQPVPRLRLPRSSVYEEYGLWRALVPPPQADPAGFEAASVPVVLGEGDAQAGWVEVLAGLAAGHRVLVPARVAMVHEGRRVRLGEVGPVWLPPYATGSGK